MHTYSNIQYTLEINTSTTQNDGFGEKVTGFWVWPCLVSMLDFLVKVNISPTCNPEMLGDFGLALAGKSYGKANCFLRHQ